MAILLEMFAVDVRAWADLQGGANVLIIPDLNSAHIGYKLVQRFANAEVLNLMGQLFHA